MLKLKPNTGDWVIVCDGRKALILSNTGDAKYPNLRMVEALQQADPPTHEQGSDSPGRVQQSVGTARSSVEQTDWHDRAERTFLHHLVNKLDGAIAKGQTKHLTIVAPPRALGMLREVYTVNVRSNLKTELDHDLTHLPIYEIEKRLFT